MDQELVACMRCHFSEVHCEVGLGTGEIFVFMEVWSFKLLGDYHIFNLTQICGFSKSIAVSFNGSQSLLKTFQLFFGPSSV
jgi:hypothetical protein